MPGTGSLPGGGNPAGMSEQEQMMVRAMQAGMDTCVAKSAIAGGMGFVLGGAFGLFMSSVRLQEILQKSLQYLSSLLADFSGYLITTDELRYAS
ncbi:MAG: hypothetical protein Q9167_005213 [Letrouitia subvulpina]